MAASSSPPSSAAGGAPRWSAWWGRPCWGGAGTRGTAGPADVDGGTLLRVAATQGLLRASVRITVQQAMPERFVELLCLLGGFLALRELQAEVDASAAVGGVVATGAG